VGWGFVAEDPAFAELCERMGLVFIGPPAQAMRQLGDKIEAKLLAAGTGVPVAAWSGGPVLSPEDGNSAGGRHRVPARDQSPQWRRRSRHPRGAIGRRIDARVRTHPGRGREYVWRSGRFHGELVGGGRHIEVQVVADAHGTVWAPGVRDCTIQRRNQKLVEESGSPVLSEQQKSELRRSSIALVSAAGYRGAGTVEYLYQPTDKTFAFMEVNTRLQVEHPVTEATTGLDLVKLQLLVAAGEKLAGAVPTEIGHAIEVRLNAEDADEGFAPAPGTVMLLRLPTGPGIRVDTGMAAGEVIPPAYDSMVAKVIALGRDRSQALARLRCALRDTTVLIQGGTTTKSFLLELLDRPEVVSGRPTPSGSTGSPPRSPGRRRSTPTSPCSAWRSTCTTRKTRSNGRRSWPPRAAAVRAPVTGIGRSVELGYRGQTYALEVAQVDRRRYRLKVRDRLVVVDVDRLSEYESRLVVSGRRYHVSGVPGKGSHVVDVDGFSHRVVQDKAGLVRAPAPAVVVAILLKPGDEVEAGATVAVVESMKMETAVRAPQAGVVREILAVVNSQVDAGAPLLRLDPIGDAAEQSDDPSVDFEETGATGNGDPKAQALALLGDLHALITGYDVSATRGRALIAEYLRVREAIEPTDSDLLNGELTLMTTFADLCDLSRNRPAYEEEVVDEQVHSPREHFHTYLRSLDVEQENLPESFRMRLSRALRHNGVTDLTPSPELEEAVYRVFLAQHGASDHVPVIASLLERWVSQGDADNGPARAEIGEAIERLVRATQLRYPIVADLARSIRFQRFEQPLIRQARERAYANLREHLDYLDEHPDADDRAEHIEAMVGLTEPVVRVLAARVNADHSGAEPLLEVLTRRYYKVRTLENVQSFLRDGRQFVTGSFDLNDKRLSLICTLTDFDHLAAAAASTSVLAKDIADPSNLVVDLYVSWPDAPADTDEAVASLRGLLAEVPLLNSGRRVTVTVFDRGGEHVRQVTLRPSPTGLQEERVIRDMHPLVGQRLDLWRLKNFDGTRLPSNEDTYLFRCVAKDNPADDRLVALAEVRDVNPLRDATGQITSFPAVERALASCLDGIRSQRRLHSGQQLDANHIFLYIWPTIEVSLTELRAFAAATAPLTVGAGLQEIMLLGRLQDQPDQEPRDVAVFFSAQPGTGVNVSSPRRRPSRCHLWTPTRKRYGAHGPEVRSIRTS
jgi:acetyl/propionyl-CoA carboxylase alpha subunit